MSNRTDYPRWARIAGAGAALVAVSGFATCHRAEHLAAILAANTGVDAAQVEGTTRAADEATRLAISETSGILLTSVANIVPDSQEIFRRSTLEAAAAGDNDKVSRLLEFWTPPTDDLEGWTVVVQSWLASGKSEEARTKAWELVELNAEKRSEFIRLFYTAHLTDPNFIQAEPVELVPDVNVNRLEPFDGSSSVIFKVRVNGETVAAFKPHQTITHQSYRGELATYRLAKLLRSTVYIPVTIETVVSEANFYPLAGIRPGDSTKFFSNNSDIVWLRDSAANKWLYGIHKEWVPGLTRFPIEYVDVWRGWLAQSVPLSRVESTNFRSALLPFQTRPRGQYEQLLERQQSTTVKQLAHQLSDLHVLDLLANNFDRYQPEQFIGMNLHFAAGRLVSIDNGATFLLEEDHNARSVTNRLRAVERFSRTTINAVRWMDTEVLFEILFEPNEHFPNERGKYEFFLTRRADLLAHVDALIERYGEEAVLVFP